MTARSAARIRGKPPSSPSIVEFGAVTTFCGRFFCFSKTQQYYSCLPPPVVPKSLPLWRRGRTRLQWMDGVACESGASCVDGASRGSNMAPHMTRPSRVARAYSSIPASSVLLARAAPDPQVVHKGAARFILRPPRPEYNGTAPHHARSPGTHLVSAVRSVPLAPRSKVSPRPRSSFFPLWRS